MNNEEKILAILEKLNSTVNEHSKMFEKLNIQMDQMQTTVGQMQGNISQMQGNISQMQGDISQMQGDISGIKFRLDYDVNKRFDAVNEGIDAIMEKLTPKSRVDELEADVVVLKAAVKALSTEVDELKKAQ